MTRRRTSRGWPLLAFYVAVYDAHALHRGRQTLSSQFATAARHPVKRWPVIFAWAALTAHLFDVLPRRMDPLHVVGALLTPSKE